MPYLIQRRVAVSGDRLEKAGSGFDPRGGEPVVNFRFDSRGAKEFGDITKANVGRPFAIVLDNKVISAPVIREPILGGSGQISGNFTSRDGERSFHPVERGRVAGGVDRDRGTHRRR